MSSIHGVGGNNPVQRVTSQPIHRETPTESTHTRATDRLELSGAGHVLRALKAHGGVRVEKVAQIKAQIEAGRYEDEAKIDAAVDRLLDELTQE